DLIRPHDWSFAGGGSGGPGITTLPHVRDLIIKGPYRATGVSETVSREKIFSCRPTSAAEERPCARQILTRLGTEAYRRPIGAGHAREADAADARRSARRRARLALRRPVAAAAGRRQGSPRSEQLPELRRQPRRRDAARDRAVLQQPRARRSQRAGSLSRRL